MAKFCSYCGKPLEEGQTCTCPESQADASKAPGAEPPAAVPKASSGSPSKIVVALKNMLPFSKVYVKKPVGATRSALANHDLPLALCFTGAHMVAVALFLLLSCYRGMALLLGMLGGLGDMAYYFGSPRVPVIPVLLLGLVAGALLVAIPAAALCGVAAVCKAKLSFQDSFVMCAANTIFPTMALLVGIVALFIHIYLALMVVVLGIFLWLFSLYASLRVVLRAEEDGKFLLCAGGFLFLACMVNQFVLLRLFALSLS